MASNRVTIPQTATDKIDYVYLNRWVKDRICEQGMNYLEELAQVLLPGGEGKTQISIIMKNHPTDVKSCFTEFSNEWGEREVEPTWQKLIDALRGTSKRALAREIENMLSPPHLQSKGEPMEEEEQNQQETGINQAFHQNEPDGMKADRQIDTKSMVISIEEFQSYNNDVGNAFIALQTKMRALLKNADCGNLRVACIAQIRNPRGAQLSKELVDKMFTTESSEKLFDLLVCTPYWSWFDIRVLETMVIASENSQARELLENYKVVVFSKQLIDLLPNAPSKKVKKEYYAEVITKTTRDPNKTTIFDLLEFQSLLEVVVMDMQKGSCILKHLKKACIELHWYIPMSCVDEAYLNAEANCHQFHSLQLQYLKIGHHPIIYATVDQTDANSKLKIPQIMSNLHNEVNVAIKMVQNMTNKPEMSQNEETVKRKHKYSDQLGSDDKQKVEYSETQVIKLQKDIERLKVQLQSVQKEKKETVDQISSKLMLKEKELAKVTEDNKLLVKRFWNRKVNRSKTVTQNQLIQQESLGNGRYGEVYKFSYSNKLYAGKVIYNKLLPGHTHSSLGQINEFMGYIEDTCALFDINQCSNIELFHSLVQLTPDGPPIFLTELLPENLNSYIDRMRGNLPNNEQLNLCHDMAKGLQFLHKLDVTHSNLHGANILISQDGWAKIADYICPQIETLNENTTAQYSAYMSPESIINRNLISKSSDIYSLGVLYLQVITQNLPLPDESAEVPEKQRWKKQIDEITEHPLLPLILRCFKFSGARPDIDHICYKITTTRQSPHSVSYILQHIKDRPTLLVKQIQSDQLQINELGGMYGFLQCMIIHSYGGMYDDKIKAIPMEMPSQNSTDKSDYSTLSHKQGDIEDIECYINNDINKELSFTLYDAPDVQRSKHSYLEYIETFFKECTKGGVWIYYTGYGEEGTGNWCFKDGTISFQDIFTLYKKYLKEKMLYIFSDCCYSGQWVVDCAKCLDEMGIGACGHQAIKHGVLLKIVASCQPNQKATLGSFVAHKGLFFNEKTSTIQFDTNKTLSDTQITYGLIITDIKCLQLEGPTAPCRFPDVSAKCPWKWEDIISLESEKRPASFLFTVRGEDRQWRAWHIVLVKRELFLDFRKKIDSGRINVAHYGCVIESGWGRDPPDDIVKKINLYGPSYYKL